MAYQLYIHSFFLYLPKQDKAFISSYTEIPLQQTVKE
jgi:hypothetical protein